ncbi:hypothetical protein EDB19DRAFT_68599 [Suillus lakei]|nr:hypothetical protein EDB19DRAFT_68599 [Suillus lakei]
MNIRNVILRTVSVVLSSFGILLSLLAIFIQTLVPSAQRAWSRLPGQNSRRTTARSIKRPVSEPIASSTSSSLQSTESNNFTHSNILNGTEPQSHVRVREPASPVPATEQHIQRSHHAEVLEAHKITKRHTLSVSPSFSACRRIASPKPTLGHLRGRNSIGSFSRPLKTPNHTSDSPLRTQPYAAPYFFPTPGSPDAIDYVMKTREELLRPSGFMQTFTRKRNKSLKVDSGNNVKTR